MWRKEKKDNLRTIICKILVARRKTNLIKMKVKYPRFRYNAKQTSLTSPTRQRWLHRWRMSTNALEKMTHGRFRVMPLPPRWKCPRNVVQMRKAMAALFGNDSVAISCHFKRSKTGIGMVWFSVIDIEIAGLRVEDTPKRWVIFTLFFTACSVQLGTKRNYKVVEEKLLGFVLVYKLACTELHGSDSFVKCVSRFCVKIRLWLWI